MIRGHSTDTRGRPFSKAVIDLVWEKGHVIRGKDPAKYRKDDLGNIILRESYRNETDMGWDIDHIKPVIKGGSDKMKNLRPLQYSANEAKGDTYSSK